MTATLIEEERTMTVQIAIAGGTGVVGRLSVEDAHARGHEVTVLSRSSGVDLTTPRALNLHGVEAVIDVTSIQTSSAAKSKAFFTAATANLLSAARAAGVGHYVLLSIVGVDDAPYGYYAGKMTQENLVTAGDVPWTVVRSTQFHEFAEQIFRRMKVGPVSLVPAMRSQPIAAREVAARLVDLAETSPAGRVPDLAGPRVERMADMTRRWTRSTGIKGSIIEVPLPGGFGRALRDGTLLARPGCWHSEQTFTEWLQN